MQVLILGDSLSFPRHHKGQSLKDSWPQLVEDMLDGGRVWNRARQASSIDETLLEASQLLSYIGPEKPFDLLVYQFGIVDAAPRPYSRWFHRNHTRIPLGAGFHRHVNRNYHRYLRLRRRPWTSPKKFARLIPNLSEVGFELAHRVAFVTIAPARHHLAEKSPLMAPCIERFNSILIDEVRKIQNGTAGGANRTSDQTASSDSQLKLIELYREGDDADLILPDGVHMTNEGHRLLAKMVIETLRNPT